MQPVMLLALMPKQALAGMSSCNMAAFTTFQSSPSQSVVEPSRQGPFLHLRCAAVKHLVHCIQKMAMAAAPFCSPCIPAVQYMCCACMQARISLGVQTARLRKRGIVTEHMTVQEILQYALQARAEAKEHKKLLRRQREEASRQVCSCWL